MVTEVEEPFSPRQSPAGCHPQIHASLRVSITTAHMTGAPTHFQVVTYVPAAHAVPSDVRTVQVATSCRNMMQMHMYRSSDAKFIAYP